MKSTKCVYCVDLPAASYIYVGIFTQQCTRPLQEKVQCLLKLVKVLTLKAFDKLEGFALMGKLSTLISTGQWSD